MSAKDTEQRLIRVIADHYLNGEKGKLTIQITSERAGISRQAFNRNYDYLKPYVLGKRPVEELINTGMSDVRGLLGKCQARVRELQEELDRLRAEHELTTERERASYITTLMNSDVTLHSSDQIRESLEKQALHNEVLVKEIHRLQLELAAAKARELRLSDHDKAEVMPHTEVIALEPDLDEAFEIYARTKDPDIFEDEKENAVGHMLKKLIKLCQTSDTAVILFVDRYLTNFRRHVENISTRNRNKVVVVRIPLFNRTELKLFAGALPRGKPIAVHVPFCASESVMKAQRKFSFRDVPDIEIDAADKMALPTIQDGYAEVCVFRVEQGD